MGAKSIIFVVFTAIISIAFGAPATIKTDKIKAAVEQLKCASEKFLPIDQKHGLGDLWLPIYFPIIMHTNTLYECQEQNTQEQSDECVDEEMRSVVYTFVDFLDNVHENHSDAEHEIQIALVSQCGFEFPTSHDGAMMEHLQHKIIKKKIDFKKYFNIEHIKCVIKSIAYVVGENEDALDWITYHIELKESIQRIIACNRYIGIDKKVCVVSELRTTIQIMLDLWKFFSEKKHVQVLGQIKAQIKDKCYQEPF